MTVVDPLALVYAGLQIYKIYKDDARFDAEMALLKAKGLSDIALLDELHALRSRAADEARAAVDRMGNP